MQLRIATWNINSVRLRLHLIEQFVKMHNPDILCLQETKCANDQFPIKRLKEMGFDHFLINGQKGYHGVATLAKMPIEAVETHDFNGTGEARHIAGAINTGRSNEKPVILHNFYVPAGGDEPDVEVNPKFKAKLEFLQGMIRRFKGKRSKSQNRFIMVGDLNVAPLEHDVWSHKQLLNVVSHTPIEVEHMADLQASHGWVDVMRRYVPPEEKLYTWWSYRARDWRASNRGRRLDHVWVTPPLANTARALHVIDDARGWEKPSDHIPVVVDFKF